MIAYVLSLLMLVQSTTQPVSKDEIKDTLARAEAAYYEAHFNDSIALLARAGDLLASKPDRLADKVNAKLQLALAYMGLNDMEKAKAYLVEMYTLDPNSILDPQQISPKVIALAAEAKSAMAAARCQTFGGEARKSLTEKNAAAIRKVLESPDFKCLDLASYGSEAADVLYKAGLEAYKSSDISNALQNFQASVKFSAKNEMAAQYIELTKGMLQVTEDRALIEFQKNFDAHNLKDAAAAYRQLVALNDTKGSRQAGDQYRKALTSIVDTWNQSCPTGNEATMNEIRGQISELLPEPSFGADIREKMMPCNKPEVRPVLQTEVQQDVRPAAVKVEAKPEIKIASLNGLENQCMALDYRVAMTRVKTRVNPDIPPEARPYISNNQVTIHAKIRIDESGNVVNVDTPGGNPKLNSLVKSAIERWKFSAAMDATGPRCVDTDIPIVLGPLSKG